MNRKIVVLVVAAALAIAIIAGYFAIVERNKKVVPLPQVRRALPTLQLQVASTPEASPSSSEIPQVREIMLDSGNYFFKPNTLLLKKGETVRIRIANDGLHTFTIDELNINEPLRGSQIQFEFTPKKVGTFTYYCAIPGHRERGQFGTLVVE